MKVVIQRVRSAQVAIDEKVVGQIEKGVLVLVGFEAADTLEDIDWVVAKTVNMRIFNDENGVMNCSLLETGGSLLLVSQFTLHASTKKGNRPSYIQAAKPEIAIPLYEKCIQAFEWALQKTIQTGQFGADMQVSLLNDGPVTILIDSKNKI
ncbi:MAG: D-tyrosyl-tRNA(Tyr) deacylase [Flavobacterium sp.]|jgi:D-tyrosyl-tRNA(Tyr) deacylase|nr:D-tyrosyl-tRNA(Tyr) deacylase [Flavobacterium sp.]